MQWVASNWVGLVAAVLAFDKMLMPIFPNAHILVKIKDVLSSVMPKE